VEHRGVFLNQIVAVRIGLFQQIGYIGQQSQVTRTFYGRSHFTLVLQRVARNAARQDFALLVDELEQEVAIFVIDVLDAKLAEAAILFALLANLRIAEELNIVLICHWFVSFGRLVMDYA